MGKNLAGIVLSLSLPLAAMICLNGCPPAKADYSGEQKKEIEKIAGIGENAKEVSDFINNPAEIATGNAVKTSQEASQNQALRFEDYLFNALEKKGLELFDLDTESKSFSNPHVLTHEEIAKAKASDSATYGNIRRAEYGYYHVLDFPKKDFDMGISQMIFEFSPGESDVTPFARSITKTSSGKENAIVFVNDDIYSFILMGSPIDIKEEKVYVNSILNYAKRIGGEFYSVSNDSTIEESAALYSRLGINPKESGKLFAEALQFQGRFYSMTSEQLRKFLYDWSGLDVIRGKYQSGEIEKKDAEKKLADFELSAGRKLFYMFPNLLGKLRFLDGDIKTIIGDFTLPDEKRLYDIDAVLEHGSFNNLPPGVEIDPDSGLKIVTDQKKFDEYMKSRQGKQ